MNVITIRRDEPESDPSRELVEDEETAGASLFNIYSLVLRRWRVMASAGLAVFVAIVGYTMLSPRIYTATALVMVNPGREQVLAQQQMIDDATPSSSAVDSEIEILRAAGLRRRLVDDLRLDQDPEWNAALRPPSAFALVLAPLKQLFASPETRSDPQDRDRIRQSIADSLEKAISIRRRGLSFGIEVSADAHSPQSAARLANRFVELYLLAQTEGRFEAGQRANAWLTSRLEELRQEVQNKERIADAFRVAHGLSVASGGDADQPQSSEVQTMLVQARADLAEKEARLRQVQELVRRGGSVDSIAGALNSPTIAQLRQQESEVARRLAELQQRYSDEHPAVLAAQTELRDTRQRISDEVTRIRESLSNEVDVARARLATLQGSFGAVAGASGGDNQAVINYRELVREAAAARAVHESFLQRFHEVDDQGALPTATSRLVSRATPPNGPSKPNIQTSLMMAVVLGVLAGAGLGFLLETLDRTLSSAEDVERKVGVSAIASIPFLKETDFRGLSEDRRTPADYLVEKPMSGFAESLRVLRTSIVHARLDSKINVLAVTSALPGEGKTTLSLCLARIAAMSGQSVVLVDCDLRRRSLNAALNIEPLKGLVEVLAQEASWREVLVKDSETDAHIIPAASAKFRPQDVFSSQAMHHLIAELRGAYDLVILDCAPVLAIAETRTVIRHADGTVIVARSDKTPYPAVRTAIQQLEKSGADILGVALNCIDPRAPGRGAYGDTLYYRYAEKGYYHN